MRRALVAARRTFCAPRCLRGLRACVGRACCAPFERARESEGRDVSSAAVATDVAAVATDATATATAEAVTEAVKRPQPDADSAAVEQPDADAVPAERRRRLTCLNVFPTLRPAFADRAGVTRARLKRDAQQPRPDAKVALLREAFG